MRHRQPSPISTLCRSKFASGATVFLKDVAQVRDGSMVQQNIVREDGQRSVLLSIIKNGNASTLAVVNAVKDALRTARAAAPAGLKISELFDQSCSLTHRSRVCCAKVRSQQDSPR